MAETDIPLKTTINNSAIAFFMLGLDGWVSAEMVELPGVYSCRRAKNVTYINNPAA